MSLQEQHSKRIRVIAGLITDREGRVLLVRKHGTSHFMQPGGKAEPDELPVETLAREIFEELGCTMCPEGIHYLGTFVADAANEPGCTVEAEIFKVEVSGQPSAQAEIAELAWMNRGNPEQFKLAPLTRDHVLLLF